MAPQSGQRVGSGGYLDLAELAEEGPVTCIFRIVEYGEPERGDYGWKVPVTADVLICEGDREGRTYLSQEFIKGFCKELRGVPNPDPKAKRADIADPTYAVGTELILVATLKARKGGDPYAVLNPPSKAQEAHALEVYETAGGEGFWDRIGAEAEAEPALAGAGAGGGKGKRPF